MSRKLRDKPRLDYRAMDSGKTTEDGNTGGQAIPSLEELQERLEAAQAREAELQKEEEYRALKQRVEEAESANLTRQNQLKTLPARDATVSVDPAKKSGQPSTGSADPAKKTKKSSI